MSYFDNTKLLSDIVSNAQTALGKRRSSVIMALVPIMGLEPSSDALCAALYHDDPPGAWEQLSKKSSCGITGEYGKVMGAGLKDPRFRLGFDYRGAHGGVLYPISLEIDNANKAGAWHDTTVWVEGDPLPLEGDSLVMGLKGVPGWAKNTFAEEHEITVGLMHPQPAFSGPQLVSSLEGGQPGTSVRTRAFVEVWTKTAGNKRSGELWAANLESDGQVILDPDGRPHTGRRVLGFADLDKLDCEVDD